MVKDIVFRNTFEIEKTKLNAAHVIEFLRLCLTTYLLYGGEFYTQLDRVAMGLPVSPILSNLFIEPFEDKALH